MKQNIRIAKQLVRIAKDIIAGGKRIQEERMEQGRTGRRKGTLRRSKREASDVIAGHVRRSWRRALE